jgi:outer membrane protein assembly factor BamB
MIIFFKKIYTTVLLLFITSLTYAQIDWIQDYGIPNKHEYIKAIEPDTQNGHFWAVGITGSVGNDDFILMHLDTAFNVISIDTFGSPDHNEEILSFSRDPHTGTMWLGGYRKSHQNRLPQPLLFKFDANGRLEKEIFQNPSSPSGYGYHSTLALADGGVLTYLTSNSTTAPHLRKYNANGEIVFIEQYFDANFNRPVQSFAALRDGRFFTVRAYGLYSSDYKRIELSFRTSDNKLIWKQEITSPTNNGKGLVTGLIIDSSDSTAVISHQDSNNHRYITKIDRNGHQIWQVKTENLSVNGYSNQARQLVTGNNIIGILYEYGMELRQAETGMLLSVNNFTEDMPDWSRSIHDGVFSNSGNYIVVGSSTKREDADGYLAMYNTADHLLINEKFIGIAGIFHDDSSPILAETNGFIFIANRIFPKEVEVILRKINKENGQLIWERQYESSGYGILEDLTTLPDGNLLLTLKENHSDDNIIDKIVLMKLSPVDGEIIWQKKYENLSAQYNIRTTALDDGGAVIFFQGSIPYLNGPFLTYFHHQLQALRISESGEELWRKTYLPAATPAESSAQTLYEDALLLKDGSVVVVGLRDKRAGMIIRINPENGENIFVTFLDSIASIDNRSATSIQQSEDGDLIVMSRPYKLEDSLWIYRISLDGMITLKKSYQFGEIHYGSRLLKTLDGKILALVSGEVYNSVNLSSLRILELDDQLETKQEIILFETYWRPTDAIMLADGSMALTTTYTPTNTSDVQVLKTIFIATVSTENTDYQDVDLSIYPNPTTADIPLQVNFENNYLGPVTFEIFDLNGRLLQSIKKDKNTQKWSTDLSFISIPPGNFYILKSIIGDKIYFNKFVIK